jgi:hypothetical protein
MDQPNAMQIKFGTCRVIAERENPQSAIRSYVQLLQGMIQFNFFNSPYD